MRPQSKNIKKGRLFYKQTIMYGSSKFKSLQQIMRNTYFDYAYKITHGDTKNYMYTNNNLSILILLLLNETQCSNIEKPLY